MFKVLVTGFAGLMLASGAAAVTVPDGSFETPVTSSYVYNPSVAGVTFNAGSGVQRNGSAWGFAAAPDGLQTAFLQSSSSYTGAISFALTDLVVGQSYQTLFYAAARPGYGIDPFTVAFNGNQIGAYSVSQTGWLQYATANFVATATSATLSFTGSSTTSGDNDVGLDNVRVSAVPEPGTWMMMLIGFGAIGLLGRRSRRTANAI